MRIIIIIKVKQSRSTNQRRIILEEIQKVRNHPTAAQIYKMVSEKIPGIGLATIYRNLDYLEKKNLIIKLQTKDRKSHYDGDTSKHCHLICKNCGHIIDIFDTREISLKSERFKKSGFKICLEHLEIHGICKKCQKLNS